MKISAINEGVSLIANIGVIASIVFLGLEMQQNTAMMQSQTRNSIVENQLTFYERIIDNYDFARIEREFRDTDTDPYPIGSPERFQYTLYVASQLRMWENEFYQYQIGLFDSEEFEARTNLWRTQISNPTKLESWRVQERSFAPDFRNYLNEMIAQIAS